MARDLDLKSGHTAYHRASLIDIYLVHAKFHWNQRNFLLTDRRTCTYVGLCTYGRTYIWDPLC